jgi:hypothetical protein
MDISVGIPEDEGGSSMQHPTLLSIHDIVPRDEDESMDLDILNRKAYGLM